MATSEPLLPPAYRLVPVIAGDDPFQAALSAADTGEDGDFFLSLRGDRLDCAILLHPELPGNAAQVVAHVAMVGLGDAVGALAPPAVGVQFGWPDRLIVNDALAGGIRLATAATAEDGTVPAWQVLGMDVAVAGDTGDPSPGLRPDTTTLYDEGAVDIDPSMLAESVSRHFLAWVHRWHEGGFGPVCDAWLARAVGYRQAIDWRLHDGRVTGRFVGLDDEGGLLLAGENAGPSAYRTLPLGPALTRPSWAL